MTLSRHLSALDGTFFSCSFQIWYPLPIYWGRASSNWRTHCDQMALHAGACDRWTNGFWNSRGVSWQTETCWLFWSFWNYLCHSHWLFVVDTISQERDCQSHSSSKSKVFLGILDSAWNFSMRGLQILWATDTLESKPMKPDLRIGRIAMELQRLLCSMCCCPMKLLHASSPAETC